MELYREYALLDLELKRLELRRKDLRDQILSFLVTHSKTKDETDFGTFSLARRINYEYTTKVKELENKVKLRKDYEVKRGLAEGVAVEYLIYNEKKI